MNSKLTLRAQTLGACLLLASVPADATAIDIGLAEAPGIGNITTVATGAGAAGVAWAGLYDKYNFSVVMASDPDPINLTSGTIDVKGPNATAPIFLYVTETDLTSSASNEDFSSTFGISNLPAGWSLTESTFLDNSNTEYGMGTPLASTTASRKTVNGTQTVTTAEAVGSTFSLTEVYELFSDSVAGIVGASETIGASGLQPAPAPGIGSGVPGMLAVGGVLLGWKLWQRRRQC